MKEPTKPFDFDSPSNCMNAYISYGVEIPWGSFPCRECRGQGWFYDPNDFPDSVEGYKLVSRLKCKTCLGNKFSSSNEDRKAFQDFIDQQKNDYNQKLLYYNRHQELVKQATEKLSQEEIKALIREYKFNF